jgi:hypothetical protein
MGAGKMVDGKWEMGAQNQRRGRETGAEHEINIQRPTRNVQRSKGKAGAGRQTGGTLHAEHIQHEAPVPLGTGGREQDHRSQAGTPVPPSIPAQPPRGGTRPTTTRPDFIFRRERVVVFVDGCFWHGCPKHSSPGKWLRKSSMKGRNSHHEDAKGTKVGDRTGKLFWKNKMAGNVARDRFVTRKLRREGWKVVRIAATDRSGVFASLRLGSTTS